MAMSMPLEELQLLMAGYVLGDLSPDEAAEFERLLGQDPAIAEEVAQLQKALEASYGPPELMPPPGLRAAILAQAEAAQAAPVISRTRRLGTRSLWSWRTGLELAAAGLIVALSVNNYRLEQALQISLSETQRYAALTYVLDATRGESQASATVVVNPNTLEATITVKNLPPLPPGQVYALWTVVSPDAPFTTDRHRAILTEVFQVDAQGQFSQTIAVPKAYRSQEQVAKVAVTIENSKTPQHHTGTPILITGS